VAAGDEGSGGIVDPLIGTVVDGRYRVLAKVGHGGMGAVYRVEHLAMSKQAAMKVLHPTLGGEAELITRIRREADAVSRLSHPNTVQVFDFGRTPKFVYLVMELVRGEDLGTILRRDGPMPWRRVRAIVAQVCDALSEAHEAGIVHRDLKPENLLLTRGRDGRDVAKVVDFGLAKLRDVEEASAVTARGSLVGTPYYMSPEQIRAEAADGRSDIYSLGAVMYRMLTGQPPFVAPTPVAVLTMHLTDELEPPSVRAAERAGELGIDAEVDALVMRAMAKSPAERFATVDELREALLATAGSAGAVSSPGAQAAGGAPQRRESDRDSTESPVVEALRREDVDAYERGLRRRRWAGIVSVLLLVAGLGAGVAVWRHQTAEQPVTEEVEPNNAPKEANLIAPNRPVRGHVGTRLSVSEGDRDYYRILVEEAPAVLHVELTGVPGLNVKLAVFDPNGQRLGEADEGDPGEGEHLPNVRLDAKGEHYVLVREVWVDGRPPTEDPSSWYTLTASWHPLSPDMEESEPNDSVAQAIPLTLDRPIRGYASRAHDLDFYTVRGGGGGTLSGTLSAIDGVDLRVVVIPAGVAVRVGEWPPEGARVFDTGGASVAEDFDGVAWAAGSPSPVIVVERKGAASGGRKGERPDEKAEKSEWNEKTAKVEKGERNEKREKNEKNERSANAEHEAAGMRASPSLDVPYTFVARLKPSR
jgi:serine/threonine-protein kinase